MLKRIAITAGDPAGIGPEIIAGSFADNDFAKKFYNSAIAVIYGHKTSLLRAANAKGISLKVIEDASEATKSGELYVIHAGPDAMGALGVESAWGGKCAYDAIMRAVTDAKAGLVSSLCTAPIHKGALRLAKIADIGHTEILANAFGSKEPLTMFVTRALRIFFYSRHLSLRHAIDALNIEGIYAFIHQCQRAMQSLGYKEPKLALAALNPHASDGGQFGDEEALILEPAIELAKRDAITIDGPIGADSVFAQAAEGKYDAVLSLYHDQGHIAAKTYDFKRTISMTLGLPILRSSVDHGTAFDIAWQNKADCLSMQCALSAAAKFDF
ncbi:MAG: 4-hydroxythreonine-4-phosphate dehydrogenase PdxA [Bradymonadales bacterium]